MTSFVAQRDVTAGVFLGHRFGVDDDRGVGLGALLGVLRPRPPRGTNAPSVSVPGRLGQAIADVSRTLAAHLLDQDHVRQIRKLVDESFDVVVELGLIAHVGALPRFLHVRRHDQDLPRWRDAGRGGSGRTGDERAPGHDKQRKRNDCPRFHSCRPLSAHLRHAEIRNPSRNERV